MKTNKIVLCIVMLLCSLSMQAQRMRIGEKLGFPYKGVILWCECISLKPNQVRLVNVDGDQGAVIRNLRIPKRVKFDLWRYDIVDIDSSAFAYCPVLEKVEHEKMAIPDDDVAKMISAAMKNKGTKKQGASSKSIPMENAASIRTMISLLELNPNAIKADGMSSQELLAKLRAALAEAEKKEGQAASAGVTTALSPATQPVAHQPAEAQQSALKEPSSDIDTNIPQAGKSNENAFAFIIANENYRNVSKVEYALNDGKTTAKYCQQTLGIPEDNIKTIYDATLNDIIGAIGTIEKIAKAYNGEASFIIYYAGHGVPNEADGTSFLLPVDGDGSNFETGYSLKKFYERISQLPAKNVVVLMDACFSGAQRGDGMLVAARGVAIKAKAEAPKGKMVVISAAQGDETAYPYKEKEHGMFTYFLLKKLQEDNGATSLGDLSTYVTQQVSRRSIVTNNKSQTPSTQASPALGDGWKKLTLK